MAKLVKKDFNYRNDKGDVFVAAGASVLVFSTAVTGPSLPVGTAAVRYTDEAETSTTTAALTTDANGQVEMYLTAGDYWIAGELAGVWVVQTFNVGSETSLVEEEVASRTFTLDETKGVSKKIYYDARRGSATFEFPEGLPDGYLIDVDIVNYAAGAEVKIIIGDGLTETMLGANDEELDTAGALVFNVAGQVAFEKVGAEWHMVKSISYDMPEGLLDTHETLIRVLGSGVVTLKVHNRGWENYQVDWGSGDVTVASNVVASNTFPLGTDGYIKLTVPDSARPIFFELSGDALYGDPSQMLRSVNRYNTLETVKFTNTTFFGDFENLGKYLRSCTSFQMIGDASAFNGPMDAGLTYMDKLQTMVVAGEGFGFGGSIEDICKALNVATYINIYGNRQLVGGDYTEAMSFVTAQDIRLQGPFLRLTVGGVPDFGTAMQRIVMRPLGLTSAEVDLVLEGAAAVTTWTGAKSIDVSGGNEAPTAASTGPGGWIDQIVANGGNTPIHN